MLELQNVKEEEEERTPSLAPTELQEVEEEDNDVIMLLDDDNNDNNEVTSNLLQTPSLPPPPLNFSDVVTIGNEADLISQISAALNDQEKKKFDEMPVTLKEEEDYWYTAKRLNIPLGPEGWKIKTV